MEILNTLTSGEDFATINNMFRKCIHITKIAKFNKRFIEGKMLGVIETDIVSFVIWTVSKSLSSRNTI